MLILGTLDQSEIERMVQEAKEMEEEDNKQRDRIQAKNDFESMIYGIKNKIAESKTLEQISKENKEELDEVSLSFSRTFM